MFDVFAIAQVAHEANKAFCESIGDFSQDHFKFAPQWQRDSVMNGVLAIRDGLVARPEDSHENWVDEKVAEGWTFGEVKDLAKKEHPCLVAYPDLPPEQQVKDSLFFGIVTALLSI